MQKFCKTCGAEATYVGFFGQQLELHNIWGTMEVESGYEEVDDGEWADYGGEREIQGVRCMECDTESETIEGLLFDWPEGCHADIDEIRDDSGNYRLCVAHYEECDADHSVFAETELAIAFWNEDEDEWEIHDGGARVGSVTVPSDEPQPVPLRINGVVVE